MDEKPPDSRGWGAVHGEFVTKFPPIVLPPSVPPIGGKEETAGREETVSMEDTTGKEESPCIYGTIPRMRAPRFGGLGGVKQPNPPQPFYQSFQKRL